MSDSIKINSNKVNSPLLFETIKERISYEVHYTNREVKVKKYSTDRLLTTGYYKPISCLD